MAGTVPDAPRAPKQRMLPMVAIFTIRREGLAMASAGLRIINFLSTLTDARTPVPCLRDFGEGFVSPPRAPAAQTSLITRTVGIWSGRTSWPLILFYAIAGRAARLWLENSQRAVKAAVGMHRRPGETRRGGVVLCNGSRRDLLVTRSIIAKRCMPARDPLWDAQKRSLRVSPARRRPFTLLD